MKYWLAILAVFLASPVLAIEEFSSAVFHAGAIVDGDGQTRPVTHYGTLGLDIDITGTATVTIQGRSTLGEGFKSVRCVNTADGTVASAFTADANVQCPVSGLAEIKAPISGCSGCTVRVNGRLTTATISGLAALSVAGSDGAVLDGVSSAIKATVRDYTNSNPLAVVMTDTNGDPITSSSFDGILRDGSGDTTQANVTSGRLHVDGSGVTQPVSGTVTVTDGAGSLNVIVDSSALPSGASTLAEQQTQTTSLQLLDDAVATTAAAIPAKGFAASGTDGTNARVLKTDTSGELQVDVLTMPTVTVTDGAGAMNVIVDSGSITANAGTNLNTSLLALESGGNLATIAGVVDATGTTVPANALVVGGTDGTNTRMLKTDTAGELQVDVLTLPSIPTGSNVIGALTANQSVNINQIAGSAVSTAGTGVQKVGIVGNANAAFDAANNAAAPANVIVDGFETATQTTTQPTAATAGNVRRGIAATDGVLFAKLGGPVQWQCNLGAIAASLTQCQAAPGAGLRLYITDILAVSSTTTSGLFTLRYGTGANCGTGTGNVFFASASATLPNGANNATSVKPWSFLTPIAIPANNAVCVLGVATNTTNIQLSGYTAP